MRYLCLDTSAGACAAIVDSSQQRCSIGAEVHTPDARQHAEQLTPIIELAAHQAGYDSIRSSGLDAIIVGRGPAPFTGLRAGLVTAQTLSHVLDIPLYGLPSLDIPAYEVFLPRLARHYHAPDKTSQPCCIKTSPIDDDHTKIIVVTDAKRKEVYNAVFEYDGQTVNRITEPAVMSPQETAQLARDHWATVAVGAGAQLYSDVFTDNHLQVATTPFHASALVPVYRLNKHKDLTDVSPLYLRRPDIHGQ